MSAEEIKTKQVKIEICHQSSQKLQKDLDIGEVITCRETTCLFVCVIFRYFVFKIRISLKELNQKELTQKKEIRVVEELKIFPTNKVLAIFTKIVLESNLILHRNLERLRSPRALKRMQKD